MPATTAAPVDAIASTRPRAALGHDPVQLCFLSGGTALRDTVGVLADLGVRSGHILAPFDSGGSSGTLRDSFGGPAIGDVRNRLLSLCRGTHRAAVLATLGRRLDAEIDATEARAELRALADAAEQGGLSLPEAIALPLGRALRHFLTVEAGCAVPFAYGRASVGNLALVGEQMALGEAIDRTIARWAERLEVDAALTLSSTDDVHLAATLADGTIVLGQAGFTSKHGEANCAGVRDVAVVDGAGNAATAEANPTALGLIRSAGRICLPIGSLWSSVLGQLLPRGMGRALVETDARRIYVPNPDWDAEQGRRSVADVAVTIAELCSRDLGRACAPAECLDVVLLSADGAYPSGVDLERLLAYGLHVVRAPLGTARRMEGEALAHALLHA
ncbi:MAG: YvcK family protein [Deltaproteobacteria bacterium]|nr:YvcK family protein [Deltaproteobacteria bacterium]